MRFAPSIIAVALLAACSAGTRMVMPRSQVGLAIGTVSLRLSNVHVVFGAHPVLVDTGSPGDKKELERGLHELGVRLSEIKCAVVTHGHADHAGNARWLQKHGIRIIAGEGDLWRETQGVHGTLKSTSFFAVLLKPIIPSSYKPFTPDVVVHDHYDLHGCGLDGEAIVVGAHTQGSLVVIAAGGKVAFVGDLFRGGALAGYVHPAEPEEHFYQEDLQLAHQRIHELLARGVEYFVLGHGGPARRADVVRVFGR